MDTPPNNNSKGKYLRSEVITDENGKVSLIKTVASNKPSPSDESFEELVKWL
ncbi:MAG: hypothetical protein P8H97_11095 [Pseudomonadales bacterium]|nr:hypothetical protein [Pseudomonadales bacterium]